MFKKIFVRFRNKWHLWKLHRCLVDDKVDVYIDAVDEGRRIAVMKLIRQILGLGLKETKEFVESVPVKVVEDIPLWDIENLKKELEAAGATIKVFIGKKEIKVHNPSMILKKIFNTVYLWKLRRKWAQENHNREYQDRLMDVLNNPCFEEEKLDKVSQMIKDGPKM